MLAFLSHACLKSPKKACWPMLLFLHQVMANKQLGKDGLTVAQTSNIVSFEKQVCWCSFRLSDMVFTNYMHSFNCAHNVCINGAACTQKFVHSIDFSVKIIWICQCDYLSFLSCAWLLSPLVNCFVILAS